MPRERGLTGRPLDDLHQLLLALFDAEMAEVSIELVAARVEITNRSRALKVDFDACAHPVEGDNDVIDLLAGRIVDRWNDIESTGIGAWFDTAPSLKRARMSGHGWERW